MRSKLKLAVATATPPPLPTMQSWQCTTATAGDQGLTLVHFSAQPKPFLTEKHTLNIP
jgi:hypothetical protein